MNTERTLEMIPPDAGCGIVVVVELGCFENNHSLLAAERDSAVASSVSCSSRAVSFASSSLAVGSGAAGVAVVGAEGIEEGGLLCLR